jgi:RDD family protein
MVLRRSGIGAFLAAGLAVSWLTDSKQIGFSVNQVDNDVLVQAGSDPWLLVWAAIAIPLFIYVLRRDFPYEPAGIPSWKRRFAAFFLDFYVALTSTAPFAALIPLAAEAVRTGSFAWSFKRRYTVDADWYLVVPMVLAEMALVALYFAWPVARNRQTVGCYLLRLRVVPAESSRARRSLALGFRRVTLGFIGLCTWPVMWLFGRGDDGSTWYDRATNSRVELVNYQ